MEKALSLRKMSHTSVAIKLLMALLVFLYIFVQNYKYIDSWTAYPDTQTYLGNFWSDPWSSLRTPGLALIWKLTGEYAEIHDALQKFPRRGELNKSGREDERINSLGKRLVLINILLLGISFSFLCFSLSFVINPIISLIFIVSSIYVGTLPPTASILADLPCCAFAALFTSSAIVYAKYRKRLFLFFACCFAIFACLIKPGMFFLAFIAGCMIAYGLALSARAKNIKNALSFLSLGIFLILGTLAWPLFLYMHGGIFVASQQSSIAKNTFAVWLVQEGDEELFTDPKQKALVRYIIAHKPEADERVDKIFYKKGRESHSEAHIYIFSLPIYGLRYFDECCNECGYAGLSKVEQARLSKEISVPIIKKHFGEYLQTVARSVLTAFGKYHDLQFSVVQRHHFGSISLYIFLASYIFLFCAIFIGEKNLQYILVLLMSLHIFSVLVMSIGHVVSPRYLEITEWSFILALELGLYSLILRFTHYFKSKNKTLIYEKI